MSPPKWRKIVAADGVTEVRAKRSNDGTVTVRLSSGAVSILASITDGDVDFLLAVSSEGVAA